MVRVSLIVLESPSTSSRFWIIGFLFIYFSAQPCLSVRDFPGVLEYYVEFTAALAFPVSVGCEARFSKVIFFFISYTSRNHVIG